MQEPSALTVACIVPAGQCAESARPPKLVRPPAAGSVWHAAGLPVAHAHDGHTAGDRWHRRRQAATRPGPGSQEGRDVLCVA
eukprot:350594-Chlamydomonas_euryale.AAC.6